MDLVLVNPLFINPRIVELFKLVLQNVYIEKSIPKTLSCYIKPLRACKGSYLPLSWSYSMARVDRLSLDISHHIMRKIRPNPHRQVLLMTRLSAKKRRLKRVNFFQQCLETTTYNVRRFQNSYKYTMKKQIEAVANSHVLMGPHGAGLTLGMFLPQRGLLVEVSAAVQNVRSRSVGNIYRNIAYLTNHRHLYVNPDESSCTRLHKHLRFERPLDHAFFT